MKVLYVITKSSWGGATKYVYDLAVAAKAADHEVVVAYGDSPVGGELALRLAAAGIRTAPLAGLARDVALSGERQAFNALRRLLRAERPDVVHLNSSKAGGLGALAARLEGVKRIIFTAHGWAFNEDRPWWQKVLIYKLAWLTILLSHETICVSRAVRRDTCFMPFIRHKLVLIYNGVHEPRYKNSEEARRLLWEGHESGTWIGMLSELHPTKRVEDAIEAFALLRRECPETRLVILGEGQEHARLAWLIEQQNLGGYARLAGFVPEGDVYLRAFDVFLHTSRSEALALAVIEAGLAALPSVVTRVGGLPEIVEDGVTGLLIPPCEPAAAAVALATLIKDPARAARLGGAFRKHVETTFDPARMVRETLALYKTDGSSTSVFIRPGTR